MGNDLTNGFLGSTLAGKFYGIVKGNFPHAVWAAMPHMTSKDEAQTLGRMWVKASKELTTALSGTGVKIDMTVIKAGRERVTKALEAMFDPNTSLDDAVGEVVNEVSNLAGYPGLSTVLKKSGLQGAKREALADAVRGFEAACFSAGMAGVARLENQDQLTTNDTLDETTSKLRLVDTADGLYDVVGDPPAGLYINPGEDPAAYIAYATTGIQPHQLAPEHSKESFRQLMTKALDAYRQAPDADHRCGALEAITAVMAQLNQKTRDDAASHTIRGISEADSAAQFGMVFAEAVRQVAGLPARGAGIPRARRPDKATLDDRDKFSEAVIRQLHEDEEKEGPGHDGK